MTAQTSNMVLCPSMRHAGRQFYLGTDLTKIKKDDKRTALKLLTIYMYRLNKVIKDTVIDSCQNENMLRGRVEICAREKHQYRSKPTVAQPAFSFRDNLYLTASQDRKSPCTRNSALTNIDRMSP